MPYLSAVPINPARPYARKLLKSPNVVHDAVTHGFADDPFGERILWRWESRQRGYRPRLLIVSRSKPDWSHIVERAGWPDTTAGEAVVKDYQPVLDGVQVGRAYEFRLDANPSVNARNRMNSQNGPSIPRRPTRNENEDCVWLLRVANRNGFEIPLTTPAPSIIGLDQNTQQTHAFTTQRLEKLSFHRDDGSQGSRVTIARASFRGVLLVTDADLFRRALTGGLGPAKAYGCGLLTLSPPRFTYTTAGS